MKKILLSLVLFISLAFKAAADEGMWLPLLLGKQVYADMVKKGLKLSKDQLYSINQPSLKDAIVIFGGFCTGEIVSPKGLIFTNHHCGYSTIAANSTLEHNYLQDGFYAKNMGEEIPGAPQNLYVEFLLRIDDITKQVNDSLRGLTGAERAARQSEVLANINRTLSNPERSIYTRVSPLFKGNQFLAFVYQRYKDIRLVGAPPEALGKFGGDTDNWEWPRHTADFSVFRVYASPDGSPADYSTSNVPLKPKWYLPVSIAGVREGDFSMIWGYPGGTNRYESSLGVKMSTDINNPTLVKLRDMRLKYMFQEMQKDPKTRLDMASDYANIANYWKFFQGETEQLLKYDIYGQKKAQEEDFLKWAQNKPEYKNIFKDLQKAYDAWRPYAAHRMYMNEGLMGSTLMQLSGSLLQVENAMTTAGTSTEKIQNAVAAANRVRKSVMESYNSPSDKNILARMLQMYYADIPKDQHPAGVYENIQREYGPLDDAQTYKKYVDAIFNNTMLLNDDKWNAFVKNPDAVSLQNDPAFNLASSFIKNYNSKYAPLYQQFMTANNEWGRLYMKGILERNPNAKMYPDATFTMRVSYGQVASYSPRDAVTYNYVTTSKGMLEKYKPGDYEFDLPAKVVEMFKAKDFGRYKDPKFNDLVTGFISSNDITGGNSGSPVINGKGELIGLAFDGNYEALSHKMAFDKDLNRTINVDVRFVLWCIDKLGGAKNIIDELTLRTER